MLLLGTLIHLLAYHHHRNAAFLCLFDHVLGAFATGEGNDEIRLKVEHPSIAHWSSGSAECLPIRVNHGFLKRPIASELIRTP